MEVSPPKRRKTAGRVVLNIGGTVFESTASTLEASCGYFSRLFSNEWEQSAGEEIFLDRDPDAFRVLLSCMRNNAILLPEENVDLCSRVLLEAEFFGVEWMLRDVKHQALRHEPYSVDGRGSFSGWDPSRAENREILKDPQRTWSYFSVTGIP